MCLPSTNPKEKRKEGSTGKRLAGDVDDAASTVFATEGETLACLVPAKRGNCRAPCPAQHHFLRVCKAGCKDHPVSESDGDHILNGMTANIGGEDRAARAKLQRRLAHWAVLVVERPDDGSRRAGGRQPLALRTPGHAFDLR